MIMCEDLKELSSIPCQYYHLLIANAPGICNEKICYILVCRARLRFGRLTNDILCSPSLCVVFMACVFDYGFETYSILIIF